MSSPISPGLHQGLEALRRWTSGELTDSFTHQLPAGTSKDIPNSDSVFQPALYNAFPPDSICNASSAADYNSDQQRQFGDVQQHNQNAWDVDVSLRELFPGLHDTPALGPYASPTTTSISTPTSSHGCMRTMPTSAPRQNAMNEDYIPEPNEHDFAGADGPYRSYAQLLFTCLYEAHNFERSLKDIYRWMQEKANKGRAGESAGWMNSVRHNLSMNAAFQRVPNKRSTSKKDSTWRLTPEAIANGIYSTTRYRTKEPKKSTKQLRDRDSKRVAAGAKGGLASRRSAELSRRQHAARTSTPPRNVQQLSFDGQTLLSSMPAAFQPTSAPQLFPNQGLQYPPVPQPYYNQSSPSLPSYFYESSDPAQQLLTPTSMSVTSQPNFDEQSDFCFPGQGSNDLFGATYFDDALGFAPLFDGQCPAPLDWH